MALYLSNSACQALSSSGGKTPVTGFHSTIDSPDSVSRVAPPTTRVTAISAATASSHSRRARGLDRGSGDGAGMITVVAWKGADHIEPRSPACNAQMIVKTKAGSRRVDAAETVRYGSSRTRQEHAH